jgi:hypothetical protein
LLFRRFSSSPVGPSRYWDQEAVCDSFARLVLVPLEFIELSDARKYPIEYLKELAAVARVPVMHVARSVTAAAPDLTYMSAVMRSAEELLVASSSLSRNRERGRKIKGLLGVRILKFIQSGSHAADIELDGDRLRAARLMTFRSDQRYTISLRRGLADDTALLSFRESGRHSSCYSGQETGFKACAVSSDADGELF